MAERKPVRDLDPSLLDRIDAELNAGYELFKAGQPDAAERRYRRAWELMPEPKYGWDASKSTLLLIARFLRDRGSLDEAKRWIRQVFDHCVISSLEGQPDLVAGTVYYEAGDFDLALDHFRKAYKASRGRSFQTEDKKYLRFLREKQGR